MKDRATVKSTYRRTVDAMRKRPALERTTNVVTVRLRYGEPVAIEGMDCKLVGGDAQASGGNADVRPGFLGLGGLGLCLAVGYMEHFAAADVIVDGVTVTLQATFDKRRAFGISEEPPAGYPGVQYHVEVDSEADEDRILEIIADADGRSPWLYNFTQPVAATRSVAIRRKVAA